VEDDTQEGQVQTQIPFGNDKQEKQEQAKIEERCRRPTAVAEDLKPLQQPLEPLQKTVIDR
jgi:hypothetical protein